MRGIDHIVLPVHDLDRAAAAHAAMGFTVTPRNVHPFGTANRLIQLEGVFLELLEIADLSLIGEASGDSFSFAAFNRDFLANGEGASMLVLESDDAWRDLAGFARQGLNVFEPFEFTRDAVLPDGSTAKVGFRLGFASDTGLPDIGFFVCQQLAPKHFWKPDYQQHRNTAVTILEVVIVADDPPAHRQFFDAFVGGMGDLRDGALAYPTRRGRVSVVPPRTFVERFGRSVRPGRIGAFVVGVDGMSGLAPMLAAAGISASAEPAGLVVDSDDAFGVCIGFAELGHAEDSAP